MNRFRNLYIAIAFLAGLVGGFLAFEGLLSISDREVVSHGEMQTMENRIRLLQRKNQNLTNEIVRVETFLDRDTQDTDLPYRNNANAENEVHRARQEALRDGKFLMVTFGANWCMDCRNLHRQLKSEEVSAYTEPLFRFVNVNVGKFNQNRPLAEKLGVSLSRGIPVAIFFDPSGNVIGTTNEGQLEPARRYSSKQILKFVRDIAERSRIVAPDAVN
jgi:thioredoxin 1